jgi:hypothetical protein
METLWRSELVTETDESGAGFYTGSCRVAHVASLDPWNGRGPRAQAGLVRLT